VIPVCFAGPNTPRQKLIGPGPRARDITQVPIDFCRDCKSCYGLSGIMHVRGCISIAKGGDMKKERKKREERAEKTSHQASVKTGSRDLGLINSPIKCLLNIDNPSSGSAP
jgi:hypothetical protein